MSENIIEIKGLKKSFGDIKAVNDLSFRVKKGELFAFLGVNGAGKSTTISIMCAQLRKDSGSVIINGKSIDEDINGIKRDIGVVFQESILDERLTARQNLITRAALYGMSRKKFDERLSELTALLELEKLLDRPIGKLSGGQKRRIDIARALLHEPEILILDEPTTGLDPQTRTAVWNVVTRLRNEQKLTVFLTTHYMEEAADADYVVILDSGSIAAQGTPLELKNAFAGDYITLYNTDKNKVKALGLPFESIRDAVRISVPDTSKATELILSRPELFSDFEITKGRMDDVFLAVTGRKIIGGEN